MIIDALNYAIEMKSDVINMSFGIGQFTHMVVDSIIENAYNNGVVFIASTGNKNYLPVQYPAKSKNVLGVGSYKDNGVKATNSSFGEDIDIAAPTFIYTTGAGGGYTHFSGTSASAPVVAGIAALMKSVNSCMSSEEIYEIIKNTATKSGSYNYNWSSIKPGHSKEFGYGRVNAYEAVKIAQNTQSNTVDLYIKDDKEDFGIEPNIYSSIFYISPDIWIRNSNDKKETHQNPEYSAVSSVYVNVKVRNKSCVASSGTDKLFVHWNKASVTPFLWPGSWDGSTSSPTLGNLIDSITIPIIPAGKDTVLTIPWLVPNPQDYTSVASDVWHFCLLARIKSTTDLYHTPESSNFNANLEDNNNVALKNVTVVDNMFDLSGGSGGSGIRKYSGTIEVGNSLSYAKTFNLDFSSPNEDLTNSTDIILEVDDALFAKLANSNTPPMFIEDNKILINENNFSLQNIDFNANETSTINLTFLFKSDIEITQDEFKLYVNQIDASNSKVVGGELFVIIPPKENIGINADAGDDQTITSDETITLTADYIADVEYKWFDEEGNLVAEGRDLTINIEASEQFQLMVFDLENGISDEDYVEITVDDHEVKAISPNPTTTGQIQVDYNIDGSSSAYLMIIENGIIRNYVVTNTTSKIIQTSNFSNGTHTIILVCDGIIKDVKQFVKI